MRVPVGVGLLGDDQLGDLGDIGVGRFERGADDAATIVEDGLAGFRGGREHAAIHALQLVHRVEVGRDHLGDFELWPLL